ncbi:MAG: 2-C-methyl-D-erythritol 4-phosphate cytidylyltransferase [Spirochaetales bacterium]|nr:2-C-methyl-D-erythritol 4-phosphate cytidylyltransferase [Spirochaetales bacterium]
MRAAAIVTAAGSGSRMEISTNKVLLPFGGGTVVEAAVLPFANPDRFQKIIITYSLPDRDYLQEALKDIAVPLQFVEGGSTRQESVFRGLEALVSDSPGVVLIHDAARPWLTEELVVTVLEQTESTGSSVPVVPSVNAMKVIDGKGIIRQHLKREETVSAQTPQGFSFSGILDAHRQARAENYNAIDDTELWDRYKGPVSTVPGATANRKITYKGDL